MWKRIRQEIDCTIVQQIEKFETCASLSKIDIPAHVVDWQSIICALGHRQKDRHIKIMVGQCYTVLIFFLGVISSYLVTVVQCEKTDSIYQWKGKDGHSVTCFHIHMNSIVWTETIARRFTCLLHGTNSS